ncbi:MAG: Bifunctional protein HldE [candidate division BRC1 bacterium ADurb.BinA364]|nr:MAG: Bifunctional protein HldE [candidate division BRC1 bacterium ADurb.BinA364]
MPESAHASQARLEHLIAQFAGTRALVLGDAILDRYIWGSVERVSPEAPVPVVHIQSQTEMLGGAANVAANLAALGARAEFVGAIGDDAEGAALAALLGEIGAPRSGLAKLSGRPTTVKTRVLSMGQQIVRLDREDTAPFGDAMRRRLLDRFARALPRADVAILSDYAKGVLCGPVCEEAIRLAKRAGKIVVVDPKGTDYRRYRGADAIKPNQREAAAASGVAIDSEASLERAARAILRIVRGRAVVISRSGEGAAVFERGRPAEFVRARARAVFDESGCGDSFIAALALGLARGATAAEAAALGNLAGSVVVGKLGAASATREELLDALDPGRAQRKLRGATQLKAELAMLRAAGKRIVFTNGCFDLFHLGHIKFLERARQLGGALVVAINSDASVRRVKGPPRPVLDQDSRAAILSAIDAVDFVVLFDEDTPERLLRELRPDVLVKGKGLKEQQIVGAEIVEAQGGRTVSLPLFGETTTDAMVEKIARQPATAMRSKQAPPDSR